MSSIATVVERVLALGASGSTRLVAIDGCGGAGKSTLASALAASLLAAGWQVEIVHHDDFYLPSALRVSGVGATKSMAGDFDWRRLRDEVLIPLRSGEAARYTRYDWTADALAETHAISPGAIVIVEGLTSSRQELAPLYDLRIWVDCPRPLRLRRGIARDGDASRTRWEQDWMPSEDRYVNEHRPDAMADLIVSNIAD